MNRAVFLAMLLVGSVAGAQAETFPEPFGLTWGMSEASLKELGFSLTAEPDDLNVWTSVSVPKAWSKGELYAVVTYKGRMVKAAVNSTDFSNDIFGTEGKQEYERIKGILTRKYGEPESHYERIGMKLYDEADEFYQCLKYTGCGAYLAYYKVAGGTIGVQLKGKSRGEGYLTISYESPLFFEAKKQIERGDLESDENAF